MPDVKHVILVNLGTTRAPEARAVRKFLAEFLSDPKVVDYPAWLWQPILRGMVLRSRPKRVAELYKSIWTDKGSPLDVATREMATVAQARAGVGLNISHAYRYGEPSLRTTILKAGDEDSRIVVVPLFPQQTGSTSGTIELLVTEIGRNHGLKDRLTVYHIPPDDPGYVQALADVWTSASSAGEVQPEHLVVSYHGIPSRYNLKEGGRYCEDCKRTVTALLQKIDWPTGQTTVAYQSRVGPEPWIGPATDKVLKRLPRSGIRNVAIITPGFLTEGLETIEEIGIRGRKTFEEAGGNGYLRVPCVGAHPALISSILESVRRL